MSKISNLFTIYEAGGQSVLLNNLIGNTTAGTVSNDTPSFSLFAPGEGPGAKSPAQVVAGDLAWQIRKMNPAQPKGRRPRAEQIRA